MRWRGATAIALLGTVTAFPFDFFERENADGSCPKGFTRVTTEEEQNLLLKGYRSFSKDVQGSINTDQVVQKVMRLAFKRAKCVPNGLYQRLIVAGLGKKKSKETPFLERFVNGDINYNCDESEDTGSCEVPVSLQ